MSEPIVERWSFKDTVTNETWTMPINPNEMTSPESTRTLRFAHGIRRSGLDRVRTMARPPSITEWSFGGVIYGESHYMQLAAWARRTNQILITDHIGRQWVVLMKAFEPTDRKPKPDKMWRFTYSMRVLILRQVTS